MNSKKGSKLTRQVRKNRLSRFERMEKAIAPKEASAVKTGIIATKHAKPTIAAITLKLFIFSNLTQGWLIVYI